MTNTLPDLRPLLADILDDVGGPIGFEYALRADVRVRRHTLRSGAETLRWCTRFEAPTVEELQDALDAAEAALKEVTGNRDDLIDNVRFAVSKWGHGDECPAGQLEARGDAVCDCALVERRESVLAAIA